jgi:hypothetical protein
MYNPLGQASSGKTQPCCKPLPQYFRIVRVNPPSAKQLQNSGQKICGCPPGGIYPNGRRCPYCAPYRGELTY